jgi:hypothetical protein
MDDHFVLSVKSNAVLGEAWAKHSRRGVLGKLTMLLAHLCVKAQPSEDKPSFVADRILWPLLDKLQGLDCRMKGHIVVNVTSLTGKDVSMCALCGTQMCCKQCGETNVHLHSGLCDKCSK